MAARDEDWLDVGGARRGRYVSLGLARAGAARRGEGRENDDSRLHRPSPSPLFFGRRSLARPCGCSLMRSQYYSTSCVRRETRESRAGG